MADLWRYSWIRETGTSLQVAQLHDRYMMMMITYIILVLRLCYFFKWALSTRYVCKYNFESCLIYTGCFKLIYICIYGMFGCIYTNELYLPVTFVNIILNHVLYIQGVSNLYICIYGMFGCIYTGCSNIVGTNLKEKYISYVFIYAQDRDRWRALVNVVMNLRVT